MFGIDIHQNMLISLFKTSFDHFQFRPTLGMTSSHYLTVCHIGVEYSVQLYILVHSGRRDISGGKRGASILVQLSLVHEPILTTAVSPEQLITHILICTQLSVVRKIITIYLTLMMSIVSMKIAITSFLHIMLNCKIKSTDGDVFSKSVGDLQLSNHL